MKQKDNLIELLNNYMLRYTNLTSKEGGLDFPRLICNTNRKIDYFATYSQPGTYFKTPNTCVTFFEYDNCFDGMRGLWNGIYYDDKSIQAFFLKRFANVKYFVAPDYSKCGDSLEVENIHRNMRSRIVSIWLAMNLDATVLPLVSTANYKGENYMLDGYEDCSSVAFNLKGPLGSKAQLPIFRDSIRYTVDNLEKLERIYVYSASPNDSLVLDVFDYAVQNDIEIIIPDNALRIRNRINGGKEDVISK